MDILFLWTIAGVHEHSHNLGAITKTYVSECRHMGSSKASSHEI